MALNYFDIFVIIVLAFFFIKGVYCGFFEEISGIVAIILSVFILRNYGHNVSDYISGYVSSSFNYPAAIVIIVVGTFLVVAILARILNKVMNITFTGWINKLLGALFGLVKGLFLVGIIAFLASWFLKDDNLVNGSYTIPYLLDFMRELVDFILGNYEKVQVQIWN